MNVREVGLADAPALQRVTAVPPGVELDQKWGLGIWDGDPLVAFAA